MRGLYSDKRAAQVAAFFLYKANGSLSILKLMKLMYLGERLSFQKYGEPITYDSLISMPHGPVLSMTLDYINGMLDSSPGEWNEWISNRADKEVCLRDPSMIRSPEQDLLTLSDTDLEVLNDTWNKFGHKSASWLRSYTHNPNHCPEWKDPHGSSYPIRYESLFSALGFSDEKSKSIIQHLKEQENINNAFM